MIYAVAQKAADEEHINGQQCVPNDDFDYSQVIVKKPWGYEYLAFENEHVAIWMLHLIRKRKTSMHCHPRKRTGLVLLSGRALFHHLEGRLEISRLDAINIDSGAFHSTEAFSALPIHPCSENGIWVMEIESPPLKKDLARLQDAYGRAGTSYEGESNMVFEPSETLKLELPPTHEAVSRHSFGDLSIIVHDGGRLNPRHFPKRQALACVIGRLRPSPNPFLTVGKVFDFDEFLQHTQGEDLSGVTILTIERIEKLAKLSDCMADYLAGLGVGHVFAVCGGGAMHLVDSFGSHPRLTYVATHHEQAAAMAAEGYARMTGGPGLALVTSGPGGTNAITGVCGAWVDSIPMVVISGQVTSDTLIGDTGLRQFGIQEGNVIEMVRPITKYALTVTDPTTIRYHLEKACHLAVSGRPGPVWLDIPLDVQSKIVNWEDLPGFTPPSDDQDRTDYALQGAVEQCLALLGKAARPVVICGYGVRLAGAQEAMRSLIQRLGLPTITTWTASDILPSDDPHYVGRSGIMGDRAGNFAVQNSDLVLIVGSRMSIPQVGYNYKLFARAAVKIMVDVDRAELDKPSMNLDLPVQADAGRFLGCLLELMDRRGQGRLEIEPWRERCRQWRETYPVVLPEYAHNQEEINSFHFVGRLCQNLGREAVVVTDMGTSFTCTMQAFATKAGQRLFTSSGFSSMGFGLPGAVGACLAAGRKTVLVTGDGGLQMNIQELQTVAHNRLPLIIFVLNNRGYLTIKLMQQNHFGRYVGSDPSSGLSCPDIVKLAAAYGIEGRRFNDQAELEEGLRQALDHPGPLVCEIMMPEEQPLIPRVSSLKLPDGTIQSQPLENLYPFLPREEFLANMIVDPVDILRK